MDFIYVNIYTHDEYQGMARVSIDYVFEFLQSFRKVYGDEKVDILYTKDDEFTVYVHTA